MELEKIDIKTLEEFFKTECKGKYIYICGAGVMGYTWGQWLIKKEIPITGFIDRDERKESLLGTTIYNYEMLNDVSKLRNALFIIANKFQQDEVMSALFDYGVNKEDCLYIKNANMSSTTDVLLQDYYENQYTEKFELQIANLKNKHKGKRAFIIGNGPSLRIEDLELLKNEITFATNDVIKGYNQTSWRPTYYIVADRRGAWLKYQEKSALDYIINNSGTVLCNYKTVVFDLYKDSGYEKLLFYKDEEEKYSSAIETVRFSENVSECVYSLGTTLYTMYQFAVYMGIEEIILIGVDFDFPKVYYADGSESTNDAIQTHAKFMGKEKIQSIYAVDSIYCAHLVAKKYAENHCIKIYNATRGGKLEIFERVNFNKVFI